MGGSRQPCWRMTTWIIFMDPKPLGWVKGEKHTPRLCLLFTEGHLSLMSLSRRCDSYRGTKYAASKIFFVGSLYKNDYNLTLGVFLVQQMSHKCKKCCSENSLLSPINAALKVSTLSTGCLPLFQRSILDSCFTLNNKHLNYFVGLCPTRSSTVMVLKVRVRYKDKVQIKAGHWKKKVQIYSFWNKVVQSTKSTKILKNFVRHMMENCNFWFFSLLLIIVLMQVIKMANIQHFNTVLVCVD